MALKPPSRPRLYAELQALADEDEKVKAAKAKHMVRMLSETMRSAGVAQEDLGFRCDTLIPLADYLDTVLELAK
jgi:hypothetical protein